MKEASGVGALTRGGRTACLRPIGAGVLAAAVRLMPTDLSSSPAQTAAKFAIMTDRALIPQATKNKLQLLFGKYL